MTSPASPRVPARVSEMVRYTLLLHVVVLMWGFTGVLGRLISLESVPLVFYRVAIALPAIAIYFWWRGVSVRIPGRPLAAFSAIGLIVAAHWVLFFESIKLSKVSVGLVCLSLAPFVAAIIEPIAYRRPIRPNELLLGLAGAAGIALIFGFETEHTLGIAVGLASATLGAIFMVMNGRLVLKHDARVMSFYELAGGLVGLTAFLLFVERPVSLIPVPTAVDMVYLLVLGTLCTAFAFMGGNYVMRRLSPFTVLLTTNLEPVYGILLALVIFRESELMSPGFYAGAGIILVSIWLNAIIVRRRIPEIAEEPNGDSTTRHPDAA